ncbi:MAG: PHP domain-containing protein [Oscillospiraceae bacterium]|jgi:histidinol-phosphatase (PHP family)|nr:PHP domain-containing protein [Oscillospiraceae bacterium]
MFFADYHTHSSDASFDAADGIASLAASAAARGLTELAVTDHCDMGSDFAPRAYMAAFSAAAESSPVPLLLGIELGESLHNPARAREMLGAMPLDFVIGAYHRLKSSDDFYLLDYPDIPTCRSLIRLYLEELYETCAEGNFDVLAHLTYPLRYMRGRGGMDIDFTAYRAEVAQIYRLAISQGKGIELNLSGLLKKTGLLMPDIELLRLYRECGGKIITCGSDAHCAADVGTHLREGYDILRHAGFAYITSYRERRPRYEKL